IYSDLTSDTARSAHLRSGSHELRRCSSTEISAAVVIKPFSQSLYTVIEPTHMGESSILWLRVATGLYSLGLLDAIITVLRRREQLFRAALAAFGLGALFQLVSLVEQGLLQHHLPVNDIFETTSLCAL